MTLYFSTTNESKLFEARRALMEHEIIATPLEIEEIQSLDTQKVAIKKAEMYFEKLNKMIFIEDVSLKFKALNGLPGTYINDFSKVLGNIGLYLLVENKEDRSATATTTIALAVNKQKIVVFEGSVDGTIVEPRGKGGFGWDPIFIPLGSTKTFAEMSRFEMQKYKMRTIALMKMNEYLKTI